MREIDIKYLKVESPIGIRFSIPGPNQATFLFCLSQRCFTRWPTRTRTDSQEFYLTLPFRQGSIWFAAFIGLFLSKKKDNRLSRCQYPTWEGTIPDRIAYCPKCLFPATQPSIILEYEVANQLKRTQAQISIWELLMTSPALQHRGRKHSSNDSSQWRRIWFCFPARIQECVVFKPVSFLDPTLFSWCWTESVPYSLLPSVYGDRSQAKES